MYPMDFIYRMIIDNSITDTIYPMVSWNFSPLARRFALAGERRWRNSRRRDGGEGRRGVPGGRVIARRHSLRPVGG